VLHESNLSQELARVAGVFHDDGLALELSRDVHNFIEHEAADPFAPQLRRDEDLLDANRIAIAARSRDRDEVADELADRARSGRFNPLATMPREEIADRIAIVSLQLTDEESLSSHAQSSLCHVVTAWRENK
jgi:hypothetical protein